MHLRRRPVEGRTEIRGEMRAEFAHIVLGALHSQDIEVERGALASSLWLDINGQSKLGDNLKTFELDVGLRPKPWSNLSTSIAHGY